MEEVANNGNAAVPVAGTFLVTYNFKTVKTPAFSASLESMENPESVKAEFSEVLGDTPGAAAVDGKIPQAVIGYKRRPITATLSEPEFFTGLDDTARGILRQAISDFVKSQYVEQFQPIGKHDWAFICEELQKVASRGGALKLEVSQEIWDAAAKSFGAYIGIKLKNEEVGERMGAAFLGKFSKTACTRHLNSTQADLPKKIQTHLEGWIVNVETNESGNLEDFAQVYQFLDYRLEKLGKELAVNIGDML